MTIQELASLFNSGGPVEFNETSNPKNVVYFLCDINHEIIYIGKSMKGMLEARCKMHREDKDFYKVFFVNIPDGERVRDIENGLILIANPKINVQVCKHLFTIYTTKRVLDLDIPIEIPEHVGVCRIGPICKCPSNYMQGRKRIQRSICNELKKGKKLFLSSVLKHKGLDLDAFVNEYGFDKGVAREWYNEKYNPSIWDLIAIVSKLNMPVDKIFYKKRPADPVVKPVIAKEKTRAKMSFETAQVPLKNIQEMIGLINPSISRLFEIAAALNVPAYTLIADYDPEKLRAELWEGIKGRVEDDKTNQ